MIVYKHKLQENTVKLYAVRATDSDDLCVTNVLSPSDYATFDGFISLFQYTAATTGIANKSVCVCSRVS